MRAWAIFLLLIMVNIIFWLFAPDEKGEEQAVDIDAVVETNVVSVADLPFEVIHPEMIKLQTEKVLNSDGCMLAGPFKDDITTTELKEKVNFTE